MIMISQLRGENYKNTAVIYDEKKILLARRELLRVNNEGGTQDFLPPYSTTS